MNRLTQEQIAALTLAAYASETHFDIYKCGCEIPNGATANYGMDFVCDACYEASRASRVSLEED